MTVSVLTMSNDYGALSLVMRSCSTRVPVETLIVHFEFIKTVSW